jgi:hypothetical protein
VLDHPPKRRLRPKGPQDLLEDGPSEKDILAAPQQRGQLLDRRMVSRSLLAQGEGPDGSVDQNFQVRRLRSAL